MSEERKKVKIVSSDNPCPVCGAYKYFYSFVRTCDMTYEMGRFYPSKGKAEQAARKEGYEIVEEEKDE